LDGKSIEELSQYQDERVSLLHIANEDGRFPQSMECPGTPPLILSETLFLNDCNDSITSFNATSEIDIHSKAEFICRDATSFIIEDEKGSEMQIISRNDEKENEIVAIVFWDLETSGKSTGSTEEYIVEIGCTGWKLNLLSPTEYFSKLV